MRLRPLTEAECYAHCYGRRGGERIVVRPLVAHGEQRATATRRPLGAGDRERLDARTSPSSEAA